jgi:cyclopropane-fatty-acyl-phospholipid synthase
LIATLHRVQHWLNRNTRKGSRKNISAHYDLGNAFYKEWLDPTMTYSSALFSTGAHDLESAQTAKYRTLALDLGIGPKDHVLEIGCGWGGFAEFAARDIGCRVTGLTISREQHDFAVARMAKAGLSDKVEIKLQDYRDETGKYDRIASIEMFEAVGEEYWPVFFGKVKDCLKAGGTAGMQIITINESAYPTYRKRPDFIQRYVFPGGMLPTPAILKSLGAEQGLSYLRERVFAQDYARTLAEWRKRFWGSWEKINPLGFDDRFKKLWEFYLHYCEAGFRAEYIDVRQVIYKA